MIPAHFIQVDHIPVTPGGKVDYAALQQLGESGTKLSSGVQYAPPGNENEIALAQLFKQHLDLEKIGIDDNFFELGASSFEIVQIVNRLSLDRGIDIPVVKMFEFPTIRSFSTHLDQSAGSPSIKNDPDTETINQTRDRGKNRMAMRRQKK